MEILQLQVRARKEVGKGPSYRLRASGWIPGIVYGRGIAPLAVEIEPKNLLDALKQPTGRNTFLRLAGDEAAVSDKVVLAKALQYDPVKRNLIHADLYEVNMSTPLEVEVPVVLVGKPEVLVEGAILQQSRRHVGIRCLPDRIPNKIEIDVTALKVGESLHVRDLKLPEGVVATTDASYTIASIVTIKVEVEAAPVAAAAEGAAPAEGAAAEGAAPAEGAAAGEEGKKEAAGGAEKGKKDAAPAEKGKGAADKGKK